MFVQVEDVEIARFEAPIRWRRCLRIGRSLQRVRELSQELHRPEVDADAVARFDPAKMSELRIYPRWRAGDQHKQWLFDALQRLCDFYSSAAAQGRAARLPRLGGPAVDDPRTNQF